MPPGPRPETATAWAAVIAGMPRQAPSAKLVCSGSGTASASGKVMYSAAVPNARFHWPFQVQTRSPSRLAATPLPTASMIPAASLWGMTRGNAILRVRPSRALTSEGLTPGRRDPDADLARAGGGRLDLANPQHVAGRRRSLHNRQRAWGRRPPFGREVSPVGYALIESAGPIGRRHSSMGREDL